MSALVARGLAAAAVAGLLFALSPLTVVLGLVIAALIGWACAARDPLERRWLVALLVGAVFVRAAAIAYLALTTDLARESFHTTFGDGQYALERSLWIRNTLLGIGVAPLDYAEAFKEYGRSGYHYPLAWLQVAFGPSPYGIHVLSVALYVGGAIVLFREARSSFGAATAFLGLALILCLPTLLLWSISPLKESLFFSLSSVVVVAARRGIGALQRRQQIGRA